jgi:hypothetical protein
MVNLRPPFGLSRELVERSKPRAPFDKLRANDQVNCLWFNTVLPCNRR